MPTSTNIYRPLPCFPIISHNGVYLVSSNEYITMLFKHIYFYTILTHII